MKKITTVRGDIAPETLGQTTMHEHTICNLGLLVDGIRMLSPEQPPEFKLENFHILRDGTFLSSEGYEFQEDVQFLANELLAFKNAGGLSVVDASPIGLRGGPLKMKLAAELADVNIICATGLYYADAWPDEFTGKDSGYMADVFRRELNEGIEGTGVKPGFLKCALNTETDGKIDEREMTVFKACAEVAAETGMSMHVHNANPLTSDLIVGAVDTAIDECGVKPERILMLHTDSFLTDVYGIPDYISNIDAVKTVNVDLHLQLLDKDVNISFDSWGSPQDMPMYKLPDDYERIKGLVELIKRGYASQIVTGHDSVGKFYGTQMGNYGFTRAITFIPSILAVADIGKEDAEDICKKLFIENPARILAY